MASLQESIACHPVPAIAAHHPICTISAINSHNSGPRTGSTAAVHHSTIIATTTTTMTFTLTSLSRCRSKADFHTKVGKEPQLFIPFNHQLRTIIAVGLIAIARDILAIGQV